MAAGKSSSSKARLAKVFGAVNIGSFRISAMIMGETETGDLIVLGSGHRASAGVKRGYVTDMKAATYAIRDSVERAEKNAGQSVQSVWVACAGAGLKSHVSKVEIEIGGRRIEEEDVEHLLIAATRSSPMAARCSTRSPRTTPSMARTASPIRAASMPSGWGSMCMSCSPTARRCAT